MISFSRPLFLLMLLFLVPMVWVYFHTYTALTVWRRRLSLALRLFLMTLLIITAAGIRWDRELERKCLTFVVDNSYSVDGAGLAWAQRFVEAAGEQLPAGDICGVVAFGARPVIEKLPGRYAVPHDRQSVNPEGTNLAEAMQLAASLTPSGYGTRIVILSDGRETAGNALREAETLLAEGVEIDVVPLPMSQGVEAALEELDLPRTVRADQPFFARLVVHSDVPQELQLTVKRNHQLLGAYRYRHPGGGARLLSLPLRAEEEGFIHYSFNIAAETDTVLQNNTQEAFVQVAGPPTVLLVTSDPREVSGLTQALRQAEFTIAVTSPQDFPPALRELRGYESILLADVTAIDLTERNMRNIKTFVRDVGGGLLMIGGPNSFGAGGYFRSPVEEVLPVTMDIRNRREMPQSAVVLAIDKSGSMSMTMGGITKIEIAKKASVMTAELLSAQDYIGVIGFDGAGKEIVPFGRLDSVARVRDAIGTLRAGGGTNIRPALELAQRLLNSIPFMNKHVILLSDGCTAGGDYERMAREMQAQGITLTTVAIGVDANNQLMESIANNGGGRYYVANTLEEIPRIFTRETLLSVKNVVCEETFQPGSAAPSDILLGLPAENMPALNGYILTSPKPQAEVSLVALEGDPLLATIRSGLGKSVAWTSDATSRWAGNWLGSPVYATFWEQAVRWTMPETIRENVSYNLHMDGNRVTVDLEVKADDGRFSNFLDLGMIFAGPRGEILQGDLEQSGPGRYTGELELPSRGSYLLTVVERSAAGAHPVLRTGVGYTYAPEYQYRADNPGVLPPLRQYVGVHEIDKLSELFRPLRQAAIQVVDMWQPLLLLAVVLFLLDIAVRRVDFRIAEIISYLRRRAPAAAPARATVARLGSVKQEVVTSRLRLKRKRVAADKAVPADDPEVLQRQRQEHEQEAAPEAPAPQAESHTSRLLAAKRRAREKFGQAKKDGELAKKS